MEVILIGSEKFIVIWDVIQNGWSLAKLSNSELKSPFKKGSSKAAIRLCNYFESEMTN